MANIEEKVESLISSTIEALNYELYDVIYEKEGGDYYLRIFIDNENGISLDDCEKVNDSITDMLDTADYIKDGYFLEVSSPGIERVLRKDKHLDQSIGKEITCNLFSSISIKENEKEKEEKKSKKKNKEEKLKLKQIDGILEKFDKDNITLKVNINNTNELTEIKLERKNISSMKLKYNW